MKPTRIDTEFSKHLRNWSTDIAVLRQNWLLNESGFLSFARDRGLGVSGVVNGEPGECHERGWLSADARRGTDLLFHPFRLHALHRVISCRDHATPARVREWNETADLAILLEPIYWPKITGHPRHNLGMNDHKARMEKYRRRVLKLVGSIDSGVWRKVHEDLRIDAASMDQNTQIYVLLRVSSWKQRERLRGTISGALWIRHMAEVIRRGFEEVCGEQWPEEDQAFGDWPPGGRVRLFGSERPFDDELRSKPYLAYLFGLFTGSSLRWYVEGETEYYAVLYILQEPHRVGIELVNLRGEIANEKRNASRKLEDALKEDLSLRRFSVISFDLDVGPNARTIRRQIQQNNIIGSVEANDPDFEFANFSLNELVEIAAVMDERLGFDGGKLRIANWNGIKRGREFEEQYKKVSERKCSLKGKEWGEALAQYVTKHPRRGGADTERPLWRQVWAAVRGWNSDYDFQKEHFSFDQKTFAPKHR